MNDERVPAKPPGKTGTTSNKRLPLLHHHLKDSHKTQNEPEEPSFLIGK
jgi:hypothetical protein